MNKLKSLWTTISGSLSSIVPLFFACCKSGACVGVCASPVASLFGISSASFTASPLFTALVPLLIAFSAVSFTISYYNLYVLPKYNSTCNPDCACDPKISLNEKLSKWIFWVGLIASIFFFAYFEIQKYNASSSPEVKMDIRKTIIMHNDSIVEETSDTTKACCSEGKTCE